MSFPFVSVPSSIHIYQETEEGDVDCGVIARYLQSLVTTADVDVRPGLFAHYRGALQGAERESMLERDALCMARLRIRDAANPGLHEHPLQAEIDYEKRNLAKSRGRVFGVIYEGFNLQQLYLTHIGEEERTLEHFHLVFTRQLFATWDQSNHRYHARVALFGLPALISTSGVVEAPAKPREFYLKRQLGGDVNKLKEEFQDQFIDYKDRRMTDVMKGYAVQALFYYLVGYPFCKDSNCRLFNAHRQAELLQAQLQSPYEFCLEHQKLLDQLKGLSA
jgi:hypothetical protein